MGERSMTWSDRAALWRLGNKAGWAVGIIVATLWLATSGVARAQTFSSGSTGEDGALDLTGATGTVEFDPVARGIDPERDGVFHFTTITIPAGVTLKLTSRKLGGPVYWLATGAVNIAGVVDLNGSDGLPSTMSLATRVPPVPGPGGYPGGVGGCTDSASVRQPEAGFGPAGGAVWGPGSNGYGAGTSTTNTFLVPLVGGSGGGGGAHPSYGWVGGGGGAGGGALLIASSLSISVVAGAQIRANGGAGGSDVSWYYNGGGGGGGAIRLVAPVLQGAGVLSVNGGAPGGGGATAGGSGRVRLEAFQHNWGYSVSGNWTKGSPLSSYVPSGPPPAVMVTAIAGAPLPANPTGSFELPDVSIDSGAPVEVFIQARGVPVGTVVKLYLYSLDGVDQTVDSSPLVGTTQSSTATAMVTFSAGFTRGIARAKW